MIQVPVTFERIGDPRRLQLASPRRSARKRLQRRLHHRASGRRGSRAGAGSVARGGEPRLQRGDRLDRSGRRTQTAGRLTAASERPAPSSGRTSASASGTASIAPAGQLARSAGRARPPAQRVLAARSTPARQAATYSPMLWPIIACGRTPQAIQSAGQRVLDGEQRRLGDCGLPQSAPRVRLAGPGEERADRAPVRAVRSGSSGNSTSRRSSPRCGASSSAQRSISRRGRPARPRTGPRAMPSVLRALAGEQEGDRPVAAPRRRRRAAAGGSRARARRPPPRGRRQTSARRWREGPAADLEGVGDVGRASSSGCALAGGAARSAAGRVQRGRRARREDQQLPAGATAPAGAGAAGASSRTTWALVPPMPNELTPARRGAPSARPRAQLGVDVERARREVDLRVGRLEVQARRDLPGARSASDGLDQAGDAGRGVEVADVGLDRAEGAEAACARCRARKAWVSAATSIGIAERRAGAVRLDVADRRRARRRPSA